MIRAGELSRIWTEKVGGGVAVELCWEIAVPRRR
jgi:hypothetical protein